MYLLSMGRGMRGLREVRGEKSEGRATFPFKIFLILSRLRGKGGKGEKWEMRGLREAKGEERIVDRL